VRLVYYGTPSLAVPPLLALAESGRSPALVITRPDRARGRGLTVGPSPVRAAAESRGIPVVTPARASAPEEIERVRSLKPDLLVVVAYGQILRPDLLRVPAIGALNVHFSLLPRHRGAAPVQAAILEGDRETGVTTMWMTEGLDEGPLFLSRATPIGEDETAGSLAERLAALGAGCLVESVERIERGEIARAEQDSSRATYAPKIGPKDARLDAGGDVLPFTRRVRAFAPDPGAYLELSSGRLQVLAAHPGDPADGTGAPGEILAVDRARGIRMRLGAGSAWLERVRPAGKRLMTGAEYANGARLGPGARLPLTSERP